MDTSHPLPPEPQTSPLEGKKTYIVSGLLMLLGIVATKYDLSPGLVDWIRMNIPYLATLLGGAGLAFVRSALKKGTGA